MPNTRYLDSVTGKYNTSERVTLDPPNGAVYAKIVLLYQSTSGQYVLFLWLANEAVKLLAVWPSPGMASPCFMASATWGTVPTPATVQPV